MLVPFADEMITRHNLTCLNYFDPAIEAIKVIKIQSMCCECIFVSKTLCLFVDCWLFCITVTYDYFANNVLVNPHHGESVLEWLPANYYQIIFNYIFRLNDELKRKVDEFKAKKFGPYTLG